MRASDPTVELREAHGERKEIKASDERKGRKTCRVLMSAELITRIDEYRWNEHTRSDAIRALIEDALDRYETKGPRSPAND